LTPPSQRSEFGMVILDDLHRLVEYVQVGGQITVSHSLLHTLTTLLTITPPAGVYVCGCGGCGACVVGVVHVWWVWCMCGVLVCVGMGSVVGTCLRHVCIFTLPFPFPPPLPSFPPPLPSLLSSFSLTLPLLHQAQGCWWWGQ